MQFRWKAVITFSLGTFIVLASFQNCGPQFKLDTGAADLASLVSQEANPAVLNAPQHSVTNVVTKQGGILSFRVDLPVAQSAPIPLSYQTLNDSAVANDDFLMSSGQVTIPAGSTSVTIEVETFLLNFRDTSRSLRLRVFTSSGGQIVKSAEGIGQISPAFSPTTLKSLSIRQYHSCGITLGNGLVCWGNNDSGQLGNGSKLSSTTPIPVPLTNVSLVAVGSVHTCAVSNGNVYCWGNNGSGQVGVAGMPDSASPILVQGLNGVSISNLALTSNATYAVSTTGDVYVWGSSQLIPLGQNPEIPFRASIGGADGRVRSLASTNNTACFISIQNTAVCVGSNEYGELGRDPVQTPDSQGQFLTVPNTSNIVEISAGIKHFCARRADRISCWGGLPYMSNPDGVPLSAAAVNGSFNVVDIPIANTKYISAGGSHSCVINQDNSASCWGKNYGGQLGLGNKTDQLIPTLIPNLNNLLAIEAGSYRTCALSLGNLTYCWGQSYYGENGSGLNTNSTLPVNIQGVSNVMALGPSLGNQQCIISGTNPADSQVFCRELSTGRYAAVAGTLGATQVVGGADFNCALIGSTGNIRCWGDNSLGQLGTGNTTGSTIPVDVLNITKAKAIAAGHFHACAITETDGVKCWGYNLFRQLGVATPPQSPNPLDVPGLAGVKAISSGGNVTCVINSLNRVACWGVYPSFITPTTPPETPRELAGMDNITKLSVAPAFPTDYHVCGMMADGSVKCWGDNSSGQLGNATKVSSSTGVVVQGLGGPAKDIYVQSGSSCAHMMDETLRCWGSNSAGYFGPSVSIENLTAQLALQGHKYKSINFVGGSLFGITNGRLLQATGRINYEQMTPSQLLVPL